MKIERFEDIEGWKMARILCTKVRAATGTGSFAHDRDLRWQIQRAAGSAMHNIAEGYDSESNQEFIRFLRYAKRSCTEVQSELYEALDARHIDQSVFDDLYTHAAKTRAAIHGFIRYLVAYEKRKKQNP